MQTIKDRLRFVALFDLHIGKEYKQVRGKKVLSNTHHLPAIRAFKKFLPKFLPDVVILGGDQINCGPISHWNKGKPRMTEKFRLKEELDLIDDLILEPIEKHTPLKKIWMYGNHEQWIQQFLDENIGIEGLLEPENYLNLEERGWDIYSQGEIFKLGKLNFIHGDTIRGYKHIAAKLVSTYRRNIRCGHFHTFQTATDVTPIDLQDYHTGIVVPAMCKRGPTYQKNAPDCYMQGFLLGEVYPGGSFQDHVIIINKGKFHWNGQVFKG